MRAIAEAPPGGVAIHCHAGKDRTGIVAALLLSAAGIAPEAIVEDFVESRARLPPRSRSPVVGSQT